MHVEEVTWLPKNRTCPETPVKGDLEGCKRVYQYRWVRWVHARRRLRYLTHQSGDSCSEGGSFYFAGEIRTRRTAES